VLQRQSVRGEVLQQVAYSSTGFHLDRPGFRINCHPVQLAEKLLSMPSGSGATTMPRSLTSRAVAVIIKARMNARMFTGAWWWRTPPRLFRAPA